MPTEPTYVPISCEFHDVLEATATTRQLVSIRYLDDQDVPQVLEARISDVIVENHVEYLITENGERIRLDRLIAVGDQRLVDYTDGWG